VVHAHSPTQAPTTGPCGACANGTLSTPAGAWAGPTSSRSDGPCSRGTWSGGTTVRSGRSAGFC
jgi:hypothetical protein